MLSLNCITLLEERPSNEVENATNFVHTSVGDPDLELSRGGVVLLTLPAFFPSVISSFFTQNKGERPGPWTPPLDPPLDTIENA